ncbi:MAG: RNA methyltransferase [Lachnospiraceae bacterium]|nr:RNA methyltransferase [Lachnospiraceae bacterium]
MITSTSNEKIKRVTMLVNNAKARRKEGLFAVEGLRIASEIPEGVLEECYVSEGFAAEHEISEVFGYETDTVVVSSSVFKKMSDTQNPQGILCVCRKNEETADDFLAGRRIGELRLLILEGIQDPGNLGTMIRTAEGAGFDAIIADENTVDVYNPKVTRSTMGSLFRMPVIYTQDLPAFIDDIKQSSVTVYAAHLDGKKSYREVRYGSRIAFLIGNEGAGLSDEITKKADELVRIPMQGKLESLNAAVAAALLMYSL